MAEARAWLGADAEEAEIEATAWRIVYSTRNEWGYPEPTKQPEQEGKP